MTDRGIAALEKLKLDHLSVLQTGISEEGDVTAAKGFGKRCCPLVASPSHRSQTRRSDRLIPRKSSRAEHITQEYEQSMIRRILNLLKGRPHGKLPRPRYEARRLVFEPIERRTLLDAVVKVPVSEINVAQATSGTVPVIGGLVTVFYLLAMPN